MTTISTSNELRSGKSHRDENFPVASHLIHPRHRGIILAFYNFVRTADDIADHSSLTPDDKLAHLDRLGGSLTGETATEPEGVALRRELSARGLPPDHAQDLLRAFRLDVTKGRYRDWDDLIDYCRYSAMPVGRFVLDVHGESRETWAASDSLCAALQVINHVQDCAEDARDMDRVYLPMADLEAAGASIDDLRAPRSSPGLRACRIALMERTAALLAASRPLSAMVRDSRLAMEIAVIQTVAERLVDVLKVRDPLSEEVHLSKSATLRCGARGIGRALLTRLTGRRGAASAAR